MKREFLFAYYETPRGKLLKELEAGFLCGGITVSCKQTVLQIGGLGWEDEFVDCSLYTSYTILDARNLGCPGARKIKSKAYHLPLQSDSVDMIIVPHLLEFDESRFQTMREIERVLKPEGTVIIISFNPWSLSVRYQFLLDRRLANSWRGHFIGQTRIVDWLKLLNFEVTFLSQFNLDSIDTHHAKFAPQCISLSATAYAVKAIKRRYNLIPLTPVKELQPQVAIAGSAFSGFKSAQDD